MDNNTGHTSSPTDLKPCLHPPVPALYAAAKYLDAAVEAHLVGNFGLAES